jgi:biotin carboxyl carrier protein
MTFAARYVIVFLTSGVLAACATRKEPDEDRQGQAAAQATHRGQVGIERASVVLDSVAAARAGVVTMPVQRAAGGREIRLTGEVIPDSGRMVTIRAPVHGRLVAVEGAPWPLYGEHVSEGRVLCQVSDAKPLVAPRAGMVTRVGALPGEIVQPGELLLEITDFTEPLVRVVWHPEAPPSPPASLLVEPLSAAGPGVRARLLGPASEVDPLSRTPVFLYRVERAWPSARPGTLIEARFADPRVSGQGLLVPTDAVVQWEGLAWVYVARGERRYVRELVSTDDPVNGGYLVHSGLSPGDAIVVRGAQQLLSEEFRARATIGEESGER